MHAGVDSVEPGQQDGIISWGCVGMHRVGMQIVFQFDV